MHFEKVSLQQFTKDVQKQYPQLSEALIENLWNKIKLPQRSSQFSAGYDFYAPAAELFSKNPTKVLTGIRWIGDEDKVLLLFPRSGLGCKYGVRLSNTVGVVDSDYCNSDNEGHVMAFVEAREECFVDAGKAFMQGVIVPYTVVADDAATGVRNGGFGSSDEKSN